MDTLNSTGDINMEVSGHIYGLRGTDLLWITDILKIVSSNNGLCELKGNM